jgi:hypothetical protein
VSFFWYPDFATIHVTYVPNERVVELKAIKLYINSYRDRYISHEESVNQILDDFVAACDPLEVTIKGDFTPRGNVHTGYRSPSPEIKGLATKRQKKRILFFAFFLSLIHLLTVTLPKLSSNATNKISKYTLLDTLHLPLGWYRSLHKKRLAIWCLCRHCR